MHEVDKAEIPMMQDKQNDLIHDFVGCEHTLKIHHDTLILIGNTNANVGVPLASATIISYLGYSKRPMSLKS